MKEELVKPVIRFGNSAGVLLPKEWLNGMAIVKLVEKPLNIKEDALKIIDEYLDDVLGIYLVGSYAREEGTERSDIDILVITAGVNEKIIEGKYNFMLISRKNVEDALKNNVIPLLPMLKEAKTIINKELIKDYLKTKLTRKNLNYYIETTKSALGVNKKFIELNKIRTENCSDSIAYSLVLRFRSFYIVDCLIKNKMWSNKIFVKMIKYISGSDRAYEGYLRVKDNKTGKELFPIGEAEKLYLFLKEGIEKHEKWLAKRK